MMVSSSTIVLQVVRAAGVHELVVHTVKQYEEIAWKLGEDDAQWS